MTTLSQQISADFRDVLLSTDEFAEDVVYRMRHGASKWIKAMVRRHESELAEDDRNGRRVRHTITATISTNATAGIPSPAWGDAIEYAGLPFKVQPPETQTIGETANLICVAFSDERFVEAGRVRSVK